MDINLGLPEEAASVARHALTVVGGGLMGIGGAKSQIFDDPSFFLAYGLPGLGLYIAAQIWSFIHADKVKLKAPLDT